MENSKLKSISDPFFHQKCLDFTHISSTCYCLSVYDHTIQTDHFISQQSFQTLKYATEDPHPSVEPK